MLWPLFLQAYLNYKKWSAGIDDEIAAAEKKYWIAFASAAFFSIGWWGALNQFNQWNAIDYLTLTGAIGLWLVAFSWRFVQHVFITDRWYKRLFLKLIKIANIGGAIWLTAHSFNSILFNLIVWMLCAMLMNIYSCGLIKFDGAFIIPDYALYLINDWRLHWAKCPEPGHVFVLGTTGQKWIPYAWGAIEEKKTGYNLPLFEKSGFMITGELGYGRENAINYLLASAFSKPNTIALVLDGDPNNGVSFRHLRGNKHIAIYEDKNMIVRAVKWLYEVMEVRRADQMCSVEPIDFTRFVLICDEHVSKFLLPGKIVRTEKRPGIGKRTEKKFLSSWPEIRDELFAILRHGNQYDIHMLMLAEPNERWLKIQDRIRPLVEQINFYYKLAVEIPEMGTRFIEPHQFPFIDVFGIYIKGKLVIGKMPYIPEATDLPQWIAIKSAMANEQTADLWSDVQTEIPKFQLRKISDKEPYIGKSRERPDQGPREEFYQSNFAPSNGNGKQAELEIVKGKNGNP